MMKLLFNPFKYSLCTMLRIFTMLLCVWVLVGCERRPLEDEMGSLASVPFTFDWSKSGLDESEMHRASICFFPHDGSASFAWHMQGDLTKASVPLSVGKYSIIVFNETTDEWDWERIAFEGKEKYETFHVYAVKDNFKGLYTRADESDIRKTPEALASWSLDEFEVTPDMIAYTRGTKSRSINQDVVGKSLESVSGITPKPLTLSVHVTAYVHNLKSAVRCSAALSGATGKVSLATGRPVPGSVTHIFIMNNRKYDSEGSLNGTIEANLLLFKFVEEDIKNSLELNFELHDGTVTDPEIFDISDQIDKEKTTIEVNIGIKEKDPDNPEADRPIVLPLIEVDNDVKVDDWKPVDIPIN